MDIVHDDKLTKFRFTNIPDKVTLVSEYAAKNIAAVLEFNPSKMRKAAGLVFTDTARPSFGPKTVFTRASISPATAISFGRASPSVPAMAPTRRRARWPGN